MPAKPIKYGIKVWMGADSANGYVCNFDVYLGNSNDKQRIHGLGYDVVMKIIEPYMNKIHHGFLITFFQVPNFSNIWKCRTRMYVLLFDATEKDCRHVRRKNFKTLENLYWREGGTSFLPNGTINVMLLFYQPISRRESLLALLSVKREGETYAVSDLFHL